MIASVIVVNWNGLRFLRPLFVSLEKQTIPKSEYEVIMVDNNSSDNSVKYVEEYFPNVKIIRHRSNSGFAKGCNIGIRKAVGKYIVLINNDMKLDKKWLSSLVDTAKTSAKIGAVVSKVMFKNKPGYINNVGSILRPENEWPVTDRGFMEKDHGQYEKTEEVSAFCGASVLLKRSMLEDVGVFDQLFFMYFEDADLSWRASKKGWEFMYEPNSIALHEHSGSSKEGSEFFIFHVARNRLLILLKNSGKRIFLAAFLGTIKERINMPIKKILKHQGSRKDSLKELWLGIKILSSFSIRVPAILLKRKNLMVDRQL